MRSPNEIDHATSRGSTSAVSAAGGGRISLNEFWNGRNLDSHLLLDRLTVHNISIFFAYAGYRLNLTANHISAGSGCSACSPS